MDQITKLVKESAVGAQQSAKACQDLSGLALDLQKMVDKFKVGDTDERISPTYDTRRPPKGRWQPSHREEESEHALAAVAH
ncbi:MAG: hypothetical protein WAL32_11210, partial [Terriglobales bacterium]